MPPYDKQQVHDSALQHSNNHIETLADYISYKEELSGMRFSQVYRYHTDNSIHITWTPSLTSPEWRELYLQVVQFVEDNKGFRDLRPRHPKISNYYETHELITPIFTNHPFAAESNGVDNTQEPTTSSHQYLKN